MNEYEVSFLDPAYRTDDLSHQRSGVEYISSAMNHYKETQLHHDKPMKELLIASEVLNKRMQRAHPQVTIALGSQ